MMNAWDVKIEIRELIGTNPRLAGIILSHGHTKILGWYPELLVKKMEISIKIEKLIFEVRDQEG